MLWTPVTSDRAGSWLVPRRKARAYSQRMAVSVAGQPLADGAELGDEVGGLLPPRCEVERRGPSPPAASRYG